MSSRRIAKLAVLALLLGVWSWGNSTPATTRAASPPDKPTSFVVAGWLPYWDWDNVSATAASNIDVLHELNPFWYTIRADGSFVLNAKESIIQETMALARKANRPVIPTINNDFDGDRVKPVITNPRLRTAHVQTLVDEVVRRDYDGIDIDYEGLWGADRDSFTVFIRELSEALHAKGRLLTIDVQSKTSEPGSYDDVRAFDYKALGALVDEFRLMTYDFSVPSGGPGPIAPEWWVTEVVEFTKTQVDPAKIMMGAPMYGYEWPVGGRRGWGLTWRDVRDLIQEYKITVQWNAEDEGKPIGEHSFTYVSDDDGLKHIVWFADHDSMAAKRDLAKQLGVRGIAVWALGREDQANWAALDTQACRADANRDGTVDGRDVAIISQAAKAQLSEEDYTPMFDLHVDGHIDARDVGEALKAQRLGCQ